MFVEKRVMYAWENDLSEAVLVSRYEHKLGVRYG